MITNKTENFVTSQFPFSWKLEMQIANAIFI